MKKLLCLLMGLLSMHLYSAERFQAVVFDFGGVVGGTDRKLVVAEMVQELKISEDVANTLLDRSKEAKKQKIQPELFWEKAAKEFGFMLPENWVDRFEEMKREALRLNPVILPLVKKLIALHYKVGLLSNTTKERAALTRKRGFYDLFDPVILSCDVGAVKPEKEIFDILLAALNIPPSSCVFIDDKEANVRAATALGFAALQFTSTKQLKKDMLRLGLLEL